MQQSGTTEVRILVENLYIFTVLEDKMLIREFSDEGKNLKR